MRERIAVVTGANRGIGRAIAEGMARADFRTVLVCRRREDGERAMEEIASHTGNHSLEVVGADFCSLAKCVAPRLKSWRGTRQFRYW
jgi:NAD(P)-dependent dehydrogenase (short-subunit alcohol dehydrogenase family)